VSAPLSTQPMEEAAALAATAAGPITTTGAYARGYVRARPLVFGSFAVVAIVAILAVFGDAIAPHPTTTPDPAIALQAPSLAHPFGTDESGFDVFSRVLAAPRADLGIALGGTLLALVLGTPLGLLAGYYAGTRSARSIAGETVMRFADIIQSFPVFILALGLVAVAGPGALNVIVAVAFVNFPIYLRLFRAETLSIRERTYIDAARAGGIGDAQILRQHVLPNAMGPALVQVSVSIGMAVLLTAGLSFIGAGVRVPTPEWGSMISLGAPNIVTGQWWPSIFPGLAMGVTVLAFSIAGQAVAEMLDPRRRR
jgi:peptide/nickel transport system permease protein